MGYGDLRRVEKGLECGGFCATTKDVNDGTKSLRSLCSDKYILQIPGRHHDRSVRGHFSGTRHLRDDVRAGADADA